MSTRRIEMLETPYHVTRRFRQIIKEVCITMPVLPQRIPVTLVSNKQVQEFMGQHCIFGAVAPQCCIDSDNLPSEGAETLAAIARHGPVLQYNPQPSKLRHVTARIQGHGLKYVCKAHRKIRRVHEGFPRANYDRNPFDNEIGWGKTGHFTGRIRSATVNNNHGKNCGYPFHTYSIAHRTGITKTGGVA